MFVWSSLSLGAGNHLSAIVLHLLGEEGALTLMCGDLTGKPLKEG